MADDVQKLPVVGTSTDGAYFNDKSSVKQSAGITVLMGLLFLKGNGNKLKDSSGSIPMMEIPEDLI